MPKQGCTQSKRVGQLLAIANGKYNSHGSETLSDGNMIQGGDAKWWLGLRRNKIRRSLVLGKVATGQRIGSNQIGPPAIEVVFPE